MVKSLKKAKRAKPDGKREERIADAVIGIVAAHGMPVRSDDPRLIAAKAELIAALRSKS